MHSKVEAAAPQDLTMSQANAQGAVLPEITFKAIVLSIILAVVLAAANAYLGLKVGITVSASIPAAVISMGVLRLFGRTNVLENNIVQTAASAGEALVAGVIFTLPALLIINYWQVFSYEKIMLISATGGILGVLFSVPLRRVLLAEKALKFPEGTAIGNVLKVSANKEMGLKQLVQGSAVGGLISLAQLGFKVMNDGAQYWMSAGKTILGFGLGFSPALLGAGYIVGARVAVSILIGALIGWCVAVPTLGAMHGLPDADTTNAMARTLWSHEVRYIGVGVLFVGGVWALLSLVKPLVSGIRASMLALSERKLNPSAIPRTERDIPMNYVFWGILLLAIPTFFILFRTASPDILQIGGLLHLSMGLTCALYALIAGFIFSCICGYLAGMVGSSANPISAMAIAAVMLASLILLGFLGPSLANDPNHVKAIEAGGLAIIITAIVCCAAVIANDNIQDLKAGQMVGATPWKQQLMLIIGVVVAAVVIPSVLNLLYNAYGIGGHVPRPDMDIHKTLDAPQATLIATIAQGVFTHQVPFGLIAIGAVIAIAILIIDKGIKPYGYGISALAVGLGIYLPLDASTPLVVGGLIAYCVDRTFKRKATQYTEAAREQGLQRGLLLACGLVAGAALMGIVLAIPFALKESTEVLRLVPESFAPTADWLGLLMMAGLCIWLYRTVCARQSS